MSTATSGYAQCVSPGRRLKRVVERFDRLQRGHRWLGFPLAVVKKFHDDDAGSLAALVAYYGFFSLFPLLLVFVTVLGIVLHGHPGLEHRILDSALARFPVIGKDLRVHGLSGNGVALGVGVGGSLWGGLGVINAMQDAMETVWDVPETKHLSYVRSSVRAFMMLVLMGSAIVATTILSGVATGVSGHGFVAPLAGIVVAAVVNVALFVFAFRVLTVRRLRPRDVLPGAVVAGLVFLVLQALGGYYIGHQLKGAGETYGTFAVVIGLLSWLYLQAQVSLLAAEVNVVRVEGLWPRRLVAGLATEGDGRGADRVVDLREEESVRT